MEKKPITQITFEDLANSSKEVSEMIHEVLLNHEIFQTNNEIIKRISKDFIEKMLAKMTVTIASLAVLRQFQPTRFGWLFAQEMLRASEQVKREDASRLSGYDVELDIKNTRNSIESSLAAEHKTEVILWKLLEGEQYDQALTIIYVLEMEREHKDPFLRLEVLNWKIDVLSKLGNEQEFFDTLGRITL